MTTFVLTGPLLAPDLSAQVGARLEFGVLTGTETGAHVVEGEIVGPKIVETDKQADFTIELPVPSRLTPAGSLHVCTVKYRREEWFYVLSSNIQAGTTYKFGDIATVAADSSLLPPGFSPVAPSVSVGDVSTLPSGSSATVNNVGTAAAAVLDFGIPQGPGGTVDTTGASEGDVPMFVGGVAMWQHLGPADVGADPAGSAQDVRVELDTHINSINPHPAYDDDIPDLSITFENGLL